MGSRRSEEIRHAILSAALSRLRDTPTQFLDLVEAIPKELVDEVLAATGKATIRRRKLPAESVVWLLLGMGLYSESSIVAVLKTLDLSINGKTVSGCISKARQRLGHVPFLDLFRRTSAMWSLECPGDLYHGMSLFGIDGTVLNIADSDEIDAYFGRPGSARGESAYPQARVVALLNLNSRIMADAAISALKDGERTVAQRIFSALPKNSLCMMDRGFASYARFAEFLALKDNRHFVSRVRSDMRFNGIQKLDDGSVIGVLTPTAAAKQKDSQLPEQISVRIIDYQIEGHCTSIRLVTSLLNSTTFPAEEIAHLYHQRWELEIAFDEIKTDLRSRRESLRSKTVDGVYQEIWALLMLYNLIRREMAIVATDHGLPPSQMSFRNALFSVQKFFMFVADDASPGNIGKRLNNLREEIWEFRLPPRRSHRVNPRHVKIKMSGYLRKPSRPRQTKQSA